MMNAAVPGFRSGQAASCLPRICLRHISFSSKPRKPSTGFVGPENHGEKIWIWNHRRTEQTVYTLRERLVDVHDLKQLPYNGKKTKPTALRKDYWSPMAVIDFPKGQGAVGRSVFQKLRELKHLHEVSWPEDVYYKDEGEYTTKEAKKAAEAKEEGRPFQKLRTVKTRGKALCAQKKNSIADLAVVLAGQGRGNKVLVDAKQAELMPVTVKWANDQDKNYAVEWSGNVTHGVFEEPSYVAGETSPEAA